MIISNLHWKLFKSFNHANKGRIIKHFNSLGKLCYIKQSFPPETKR